MGCHGALNGLRVANSFVRQDPRSVPSVPRSSCAACTINTDWDPEQIVANALFADGAGSWSCAASADDALRELACRRPALGRDPGH